MVWCKGKQERKSTEYQLLLPEQTPSKHSDTSSSIGAGYYVTSFILTISLILALSFVKACSEKQQDSGTILNNNTRQYMQQYSTQIQLPNNIITALNESFTCILPGISVGSVSQSKSKSNKTTSYNEDLTLIRLPEHDLAKCMDGSPPSYYIRKGFGAGQNKFMIWLQGGGWCFKEAP